MAHFSFFRHTCTCIYSVCIYIHTQVSILSRNFLSEEGQVKHINSIIKYGVVYICYTTYLNIYTKSSRGRRLKFDRIAEAPLAARETLPQRGRASCSSIIGTLGALSSPDFRVWVCPGAGTLSTHSLSDALASPLELDISDKGKTRRKWRRGNSTARDPSGSGSRGQGRRVSREGGTGAECLVRR